MPKPLPLRLRPRSRYYPRRIRWSLALSLLCVAPVFLVAACGDDTSTGSDGPSPNPNFTPEDFAISVPATLATAASTDTYAAKTVSLLDTVNADVDRWLSLFHPPAAPKAADQPFGLPQPGVYHWQLRELAARLEVYYDQPTREWLWFVYLHGTENGITFDSSQTHALIGGFDEILMSGEFSCSFPDSWQGLESMDYNWRLWGDSLLTLGTVTRVAAKDGLPVDTGIMFDVELHDNTAGRVRVDFILEGNKTSTGYAEWDSTGSGWYRETWGETVTDSGAWSTR